MFGAYLSEVAMRPNPEITLFCATSPVATPTPYGASASAIARWPTMSSQFVGSSIHRGLCGEQGFRGL
jgi:hypothetical protein